MELKSLPYVYSLMGIITVLCKGFILLCSMHKNVLSLMISSSVLFTSFFKGNWVTLALVDAGSALTCSASLPCYEITQRTRVPPSVSDPSRFTFGSCGVFTCSPLVTRQELALCPPPATFSQEAAHLPAAQDTVALSECAGGRPGPWHNVCSADDAFSS